MKTRITMLASLMCLSFGAFAQITTSDLPYWRPYDQRGVNQFEPSKNDSVPFDGLKVRIGGGFAQQFQGLKHSNTALPRYDVVSENGKYKDVNQNQLYKIGNGFNLATANLNIDVVLADGIRMNLVSYLSSRHHPETWVKGGYLQVDKLAFLNSPIIDKIMEKTSIRVGHMEVNYGDQHFRRTDNAHALQNPFVGNYIMDAFATEIGADVTVQHNGFLAVAGVTEGEIQGGINRTDERGPSFIGKLGYDKQLKEDLRVRLTGSIYHTGKSIRNTLYAGDRAGSRYYLVMENTLATTAGNFTSGRFSPNLTNKLTAVSINPFIKFHGLEFFGTLEQAKGNSDGETKDRAWTQLAGDVIYRIGKAENFYVGGRYNTIKGDMLVAGAMAKPSISRIQLGAGWFVTKNILAKVEYVNQEYKGFAANDIRNGGKFSGIMLEGAISF